MAFLPLHTGGAAITAKLKNSHNFERERGGFEDHGWRQCRATLCWQQYGAASGPLLMRVQETRVAQLRSCSYTGSSMHCMNGATCKRLCQGRGAVVLSAIERVSNNPLHCIGRSLSVTPREIRLAYLGFMQCVHTFFKAGMVARCLHA